MTGFVTLRRLFYGLAVMAALLPALAHTALATGDNLVTISDPWARLTPMSGAIFGTLRLNGQVEDQVTGVTCPDTASHVEVHFTAMKDGVMKMQAVETLALSPGMDVKLEPGGMHVMLMGLKDKLEPGDNIACTMTFEHAQALHFTATVRPLGSAAAQ